MSFAPLRPLLVRSPLRCPPKEVTISFIGAGIFQSTLELGKMSHLFGDFNVHKIGTHFSC